MAYALHRTQKAQTLRFDPSCQLLIIFRRYLIALNIQLGQIEADRRLNEWLCDPHVPPTELLQCGILSLTREWRFLVELLALSAEDLRRSLASPSPDLNRRMSMSVPSALRRSMDVTKAMRPAIDQLTGKTGKRHRMTSRMSRTAGETSSHAPMSVPTSRSVVRGVNFVGDPNSDLTSKLLRMAAGPISPSINYTTHQTRRSKVGIDNNLAGTYIEASLFCLQFYHMYTSLCWTISGSRTTLSDSILP